LLFLCFQPSGVARDTLCAHCIPRQFRERTLCCARTEWWESFPNARVSSRSRRTRSHHTPCKRRRRLAAESISSGFDPSEDGFVIVGASPPCRSASPNSFRISDCLLADPRNPCFARPDEAPCTPGRAMVSFLTDGPFIFSAAAEILLRVQPSLSFRPAPRKFVLTSSSDDAVFRDVAGAA